ncbi:hypothetical protein JCM3770_004327 [Rhodotorula araucariae]
MDAEMAIKEEMYAWLAPLLPYTPVDVGSSPFRSGCPWTAPARTSPAGGRHNVVLQFGRVFEVIALSSDYDKAVARVEKRVGALGPDQVVYFFSEVPGAGWACITPSAWEAELEKATSATIFRVVAANPRSKADKGVFEGKTEQAAAPADAAAVKSEPHDELMSAPDRDPPEHTGGMTQAHSVRSSSEPDAACGENPYARGIVRLNVKPLAGKLISITVYSHTTIENVRLVLDNLWGSYAVHSRLIHAGKQLEDKRSISDYGMKEGDTMYVVPRLRGGKPVVYLFPPTHLPTATVSLALSPEWNFSALYPVVDVEKREDGGARVEWTVSASPGDSLVDLASGLDLKYLFWEAITTGLTSTSPLEPAFHPSRPSLDRTNGVALPFTAFLAHLDTALASLSLHTAARNDFLTYWMAHFTRIRDAGQLVAFRFVPQAEFARAAELNVEPRPDVVTRVFLLFKGVDAGGANEGWRSVDAVDWVREVGLEEDKVRDEALFRVLEWGGMEVA